MLRLHRGSSLLRPRVPRPTGQQVVQPGGGNHTGRLWASGTEVRQMGKRIVKLSQAEARQGGVCRSSVEFSVLICEQSSLSEETSQHLDVTPQSRARLAGGREKEISLTKYLCCPQRTNRDVLPGLLSEPVVPNLRAAGW